MIMFLKIAFIGSSFLSKLYDFVFMVLGFFPFISFLFSPVARLFQNLFLYAKPIVRLLFSPIAGLFHIGRHSLLKFFLCVCASLLLFIFSCFLIAIIFVATDFDVNSHSFLFSLSIYALFWLSLKISLLFFKY